MRMTYTIVGLPMVKVVGLSLANEREKCQLIGYGA